MMSTICPQCAYSPLPEGAKYCPACGVSLAQIETMSLNNLQTSSENPSVVQWQWALLSIVITLGLSFIFITVFHWPIFILGAFLPLAWRFSQKK